MPSQTQATASSSSTKPPPDLPTWRFTNKAMNVLDLSRDDDFLSHLLVEKLGTVGIPLHVHKMDPGRRLPRVPADDMLDIVRRLVGFKGTYQHAIKAAVDQLLTLHGVRFYMQSFDQKQVNAFATHASRYFALYNPSGNIEIAHTHRYSHKTGKSELCVLATRPLTPGMDLMDLTGSMADLTEAQDLELKRTDLRNSHGGIRRDFSVIHSRQMKKNHLFLGPARFVNHDCDNNCELLRKGKLITFRVIKPIAAGEEVTAHYGDSYFGRNNKHCLCESCEKVGRGGYRPRAEGEDSDADEPSDGEPASRTETPAATTNVNVNERRTRRGVYKVLSEDEDAGAGEEEEEEEEEAVVPTEPIRFEAEESREPSTMVSAGPSSTVAGPSTSLITPPPDAETPSGRPSLTVSTAILPPTTDSAPSSATSSRRPKFEPVISTRAQKARAAELAKQQAPITPPLSEDSATPMRTRSRSRMSTPTVGAVQKGNTGSTSRSASVGAGKNASGPATTNGNASVPRGSGRSRAGTQDVEVPKANSGKGKEKQTGPPTCATCNSVLPVISMDGQIVWGEFGEERGRKKKEEHECPRCLRHSAIYQQSWPHRAGFNTTAFHHLAYSHQVLTPRSSTPAAGISTSAGTHKLLKAVDSKLQQKFSGSTKPSASRSSSVSTPAPTAAGTKRKATVEHREDNAKRRRTDADSAKDQSALVSRSGRAVVPSAKLRESAEPPKRGPGRPRKDGSAPRPAATSAVHASSTSHKKHSHAARESREPSKPHISGEPSVVMTPRTSLLLHKKHNHTTHESNEPPKPQSLPSPPDSAPPSAAAQKTRAQRAEERARVVEEQYQANMQAARAAKRAREAERVPELEPESVSQLAEADAVVDSSPLSCASEIEDEPGAKRARTDVGPLAGTARDTGTSFPSPAEPEHEFDFANRRKLYLAESVSTDAEDDLEEDDGPEEEEERPVWRPPRMGGAMFRPTPAMYAQMKWAEQQPTPEPERLQPEPELEHYSEPVFARIGMGIASLSSRAKISTRFDVDEEVEVLEVATATSSGGPVTPEDQTSDGVIHILDSDDEPPPPPPPRMEVPHRPIQVHDDSDSEIELVELIDEEPEPPKPVTMRPKGMSSLWRPSPVEFARRRWERAAPAEEEKYAAVDRWRNASAQDDGESDIEEVY